LISIIRFQLTMFHIQMPLEGMSWIDEMYVMYICMYCHMKITVGLL
jgi:hypothetical protein